MLRLIACTLLAAAAPLAPGNGPKGQEAEKSGGPQPPHVFQFTPDGQGQGGAWKEFKFPDAPYLMNTWSSVASSGEGGLGLAKVDDATRVQLGVPEGRGLIATSVSVQGPAFAAGVREQDVLLTLDDQPLVEVDDLGDLLKKSGDKPATLGLIRKRKPTTLKVAARVSVELGPVQQAAPEFWIGVQVEPVSALLREQLDLPADGGLVVAQLIDGAPAQKCGLKVHDVVRAVDGQAVADSAALVAHVAEVGDKPMAFDVVRAGDKVTVAVTAEKRPARDVVRGSFRINRPVHGVNYVDVVRPGVVMHDNLVDYAIRNYHLGPAVPPPPAPGVDGRVEAMAAEIKALREAVDSLRKALEEKK